MIQTFAPAPPAITAQTLNWPALDSLDMGSLISPDGRDTPLLPSQPIVPLAASSSASSTTDASSAPASTTSPVSLGSLLPSVPDHFGARLAVGAIAVVVILIVVWRIVAPPLPV